MRFCLTCNRLGAGVDSCIRDRSACKIVDRGHRIRSRDDLAADFEAGDLIDDADAARGKPNDGDAAPQVELPAPVYCYACGVERGDACPRRYTPEKCEMLDALLREREQVAMQPEESKMAEEPNERHAVFETPSGAGAHGILTEAAAIVEGVRNEQHGDKERSFTAIAAVWTTYLATRKDPPGPVRPRDVAQMMILMKMCRAEWGTPIRDHYVDMAGYAGIAGEVS